MFQGGVDVPKLVISGGYDKPQLFALPEGETSIGRGMDCGLVLPTSSVSRHHASLFWDGRALVLRDKDSRNGLTVNGAPQKETPLRTGDLVEIGGFKMKVLADDEKFYEGRFVDYLPTYRPNASASRGQTVFFGDEPLTDVEGRAGLIKRQARITQVSDPTLFWCPEEHELTFGGSGMVEVTGMFTAGEVARIRWENGLHVLTKNRSMVAVKHNGKSISRGEMHHGDRFTVGKTEFLYTSIEGY